MHIMLMVFPCGWKMSHRTHLLLIKQICLLLNIISVLKKKKKKVPAVKHHALMEIGKNQNWGSLDDRPNKRHYPDEPIKYHRPPRSSMDDRREVIKKSIQYLGWLRISQKTVGRPIKAPIEWAQRRYKRGTYATLNRVQWLEEKGLYIYAFQN